MRKIYFPAFTTQVSNFSLLFNQGSLIPGKLFGTFSLRSTYNRIFIVLASLLFSGISHVTAQTCSENDIGFNANNNTNTLTICEGTTGTTIDGGSPAGTPAYVWEVATNIGGPYSTVSPDPGDVQNWTISSTYYNTPGTWFFRRVTTGSASCDENSDIITLEVNALPATPAGATTQTFCAIDNPTVVDLAATGTAIQWYTTSSGGTALATTDALVNGHYFASQTVSGCESATRLDVTVTVDDPATPGGSQNQTFCAIDNPTVADLIASGTSINWYTTSSGGSALATSTALVNGTHYFASQTVSGCESTIRLEVTVTVDDPAAPTGTAVQTFCAIGNPTVADLAATGTSIQWYTAASGGTALATALALVNGTHYYASQTVSGCESATRFDVTATIGIIAAPTGSSPQAFCAIDNPTVADLAATGTLVQWYAVATGGTALATSTALVNGTHYFASQTVSGCESATRFDVTATVGNPGAPTGTATQTFCAIDNPTIADLTVTGSIIQWYAASSGGTALATSTALVNGTHYFASQTVVGCESATRLDVSATVNNPVAPTGSLAQTFCAIDNPTVADLAATGSSILWYAASSGGTALATSTALVNGTHYFASQTVAGCESANRLDVTVTVSDPAAPTGTAGQTFCAISNPTVADLLASGTSIQWYAASTGGTALATSVALVNGTHYFATQTVSGCESDTRFDVTVTIGILLAPTGSAAQSFCTIDNPTVSALVATGTLIQWYTVATGGTALATSTPLVNGTHYFASQTVSGCESPTRLDVTVTIGNPAAPTGSASQSFCVINNPTVADLTATGTSIQWYAASTGGTALATSTALVNGTHYFASQTVAGCESANRFDVTATVGNPTAPTGAASQSFCAIDNPTVANLVATGTAVQWYTVSTGGTAIATSTTLVNGTHYFASQTVAGCESALRLDVTATVGNPAAPTGTAVQAFCAIDNQTVADLTATGSNIKWYAAASGGIALATSTPLVNGTHYFASQTVAGCEGISRFDVTVNVGNAAAPTGAASQAFCVSSNPAVSNLAATGSIILWYSVATGGTPILTSTPLVDGTHYYASQTVSGCEGTTRLDVTATVNPTPSVAPIPGDQTICNNSPTSTVIFSGPIPGTSYAWTNSITSIGLAASGIGNIGSFTATNPGTTPVVSTIRVTPTANSCPGPFVDFLITVNPTATVTAVSNQTLCNGASTSAVNFNSPTTGGTIVYNWTNNNITIGLGASGTGNIPSFTATNSSTAPVTATITVTPSYTNGATCTGTSITFTITVNPTATVNAVSNQTICNGDASTAINFAGPVAGTTFNWTNNLTSIGLGASGTGNIASFIAANISTGPVTATISIIPTANGCPGTPGSFTIIVSPDPTATNPGNQTVCNGTSTTAISFSGPVTGTTFTWTNNTPSIGLGASGSGDIGAFTAVNGGTSPVIATITLTPSANGCLGIPITFTITVNPTASANLVANQTVCNGAPVAAINFGGPVAGTTFNWTNNTPSIGLGASGSGNIASFNGINAGTAPVTATISVIPTANGCAAVTATSFTITVNPTPTVNGVTGQTLCRGSNTTVVNFSGSVTGTVFNWTNNTPAIGLGATGSGDIGSFTAANPGGTPLTATLTVTPTANGCTGTPTTFTITVNPTATIINPANQTVCNGAATTLVTFSGPVTWTNNNTSINLTGSGTGDIPSFTTTNPGTTVVTATVTAIPTANGCTGNPVPFNITVNPTATVNPIANQAVCNGTLTTLITFGSPVSGTTYTWTNNTTSIGLGASGSFNNIAAFTGVNAGAAPVTATITVTPTANGCTGTPLPFTITVYPTTIVNNPGNQIVCKGAPATVNFTGTAGATYNWTNTNTAIGLAASGTGNLSFTALNDTSIAKTATISVTPTANGCTGATINFNITVNPAVAITGNTMSGQGCNKTSFSITPVDSLNGVVPAGSTYSWSAPSLPAGLTGGAAGSGTGITGNLTNSTAGGLTATYTVTPTSGTCPGTPFTLLVTVYPYPAKQTIDFFQTNVKSQQLCIGALVGGGGQNDIDVHWDPPLGTGGQPPTNWYDLNNYDWDWEYATGTAVGPTIPFASSPGTNTIYYQHRLPPSPSIFSPIGDYWFRFYISQNGCTTYTDTVHLQVTSTLITTAGGPYVYCYQAVPQPVTLSGSSVTGTSTTTISGQWSIFSGGGTLSNTTPITTGNAAISAVTYTPAAGFTGTARLVLRSNDPDGAGGCQPAADTAYVIVLPLGNLQGCTAPANWTFTNTNANGSHDDSQVPCAITLIGGDNGSGTTGRTDFTVCAGAGNFTFNWVFTAPSTPGPTPVWHTADQTYNSGPGSNRGSFVANRPLNLVAGDLIVVILHARDNVGSVAAPDGFSSIRKDVSGNSGNDNRGTVMSYWKIATATEPATYSFQANSMGTNDTWVAIAGRVTGADATNPIDVTNGTNSGTSGVTSITVPSVTTLGTNRLLVSAVSIIDDDHGNITEPGTMTLITEGNSASGDDITYGDYFQNIPATGATGTRQFTWTASDAAAAQMFAIKPAGIPDDSAWVTVNGVKSLISGVDGTAGSFSIPVNTNDVIGFRMTTLGNNGGPGRLTAYSVVIPNDSPQVVGNAAITIAACNPVTPTNSFVNPTASDNCGNTPALVAGYPQTGPVIINGCSNTQTRTWLYVDNCGIQSRPFNQTITWTTDPVAPTITCVPPQNLCQVPGNIYTIPVLSATDNCIGSITYGYSITGVTTRSGTGNDASGLFNLGTSTIAWSATDGCGNTSTCNTTVIIGAVPTAIISVSGATSICNGGSTTISVALTGTAPWSITYTDGGTPVTVNGILTTPYTFNVSPTSNTTWTLTAMSAFNCSGTVSGSAIVTVRPLPTAIISGSAIICSGSSTNLAIALTGQFPWTVTYTDGVTVFPLNTTVPNVTIPVSPITTTTYTLTAVSDANCAGTSLTGSAVVTVNPRPTVVVNPAAPSICIGSSIALVASGASTYSWSPSTGLSATTGASVNANPVITTTYTVTGTDINGCINTKTVTVTVNPLPVTTGIAICPGATGTISSSTVCVGGTFTTGPNNPGIVVDDASIGTGTPWANPAFVINTSDASYATLDSIRNGTVAVPAVTHYLKATNYGFSIPPTATINSITVVIRRRVLTFSPAIRDNVVSLVKAGTVTGNNQASALAWPNGVFGTQTYPVGLWGTTWTAADINDPNFGLVFSVRSTLLAGRHLDVDSMQISVNYTITGGINWYTASSGGSSIGTGSPFNPVPSGLANTNTPGTTTFYAECSAIPGCRTATNFVINPSPTISTTAAAANVCFSGAAQASSLSYGATTNTPTNYSITWNPAALAAGLVNLGSTAITASPLSFPVAAGVVAGTYTGTISVTSASSCASAGNSFTLTIDPVASLVLSSAAGTNNQMACVNIAITPITYNVTGATGAGVSGLPGGVTGGFNAGVFTISGSPAANGTFNYTITTTGGCGVATATGSIIVQSQAISLTSGSATPTLCENTVLTDIVYTISGTATSASASGLPSGVTGSLVGNVFTISGTPSGASGSFPYTVTTSGTCGPATANGTITVLPAAGGGTLSSVLICSGASGNITLSGQSGTISRWEVSTDGGATWANIANTTVTQSYTNVTVETLYRVLVNGGVCATAYSSIATLSVHNLWTGITSIDWNTATNWSGNVLPNISCPDVIIPAATPFSPLLTTGTATINNLIIRSGAILTINNTGRLQLAGTINVNAGGSFDVQNGSLEFNGASPQNIGGNMFVANTLKNLRVSNPNGLTVSNTAGNLLKIAGDLDFGNVSNANVITGDNLVLISTAAGTSRVADITNNGANSGNRFTGRVTVERYFPARRSWRLLTSPLSNTGNIFDSWQISAPVVYVPGRGMFVSGPNPTGSTGNGLDWSFYNNYSMKAFDAITNNYINIGNTITQNLSTNAANAANIGYFTFVRGDRTRSPDNTIFGNTNNTTLSSTGILQTGTQTFNVTSPVGFFQLIGNPYVSSVDFQKITKVNVNPLRYYVYDASLGTLGLMVVMEDFDVNGVFTPTNIASSIQTNHIQSSQAFFVETTGGGASVIFNENDKSNDYNPALFRPVNPLSQPQSFRTNLLLSDPGDSTLLVDGILEEFDDIYNDSVDLQDAIKFTNINENLGILRYNKVLAVERRPIVKANDTIFLRLTKTTVRNYRFDFEPTGLDPALTAFLEDSYTGIKTPLDVVNPTTFAFAITGDAASAVPDRFRLVFKPSNPLPVTFTSIKAYQLGPDIGVDWTVEHEINIKKYDVEKSRDGISFTKVNTTPATPSTSGSKTYNWLDAKPQIGNNFYRVRSTSLDGSFAYSRVVLVKMVTPVSGIRIYPNPVSDGIINAEFKNMAAGVYHVRLLNQLGQVVLSDIIIHAPGTSIETVKPDYKLASGIYKLEVIAPDKKTVTVKVIFK